MRECELAVASMKPNVYCLSESNSDPVSIALKQLAPDISLEQIDNQALNYDDITVIQEIARTNDSVVSLGIQTFFLYLFLFLFLLTYIFFFFTHF